MWQDIVIMIANFFIALALLPTVRGNHKPEPLTSALDGGMLLLIAGAFATLHLWLSMAATLCSATLWFILLGQVLAIKRRKNAKN